MDKKGIKLVIGLLGSEDEEPMMDKESLLDNGCPLATQDADINKGNQKKAMILANYPSTEKGKCADCEYWETDMEDCGVPKGKGFCEKFEFVCSANKGCYAFEGEENEND